MKSVLIINGPNIKQIGVRETGIYGSQNIDDYFVKLKHDMTSINFNVRYINAEADITAAIHNSSKDYVAVIINPGAYTHSSLAIADAVSSVAIPVIEVHVSNINTRSFYRRTSYLSEVCMGTITGFGLASYKLALQYILESQSYTNS